jgi:hypothetical protein
MATWIANHQKNVRVWRLKGTQIELCQAKNLQGSNELKERGGHWQEPGYISCFTAGQSTGLSRPYKSVREAKAEVERMPAPAECAEAPVSSVLAGWDELAAEIDTVSGALRDLIYHGLKGSWKIGALILEFADRDDVLREVEIANEGRRGRPWLAPNFVAQTLADRYDFLPSARWLKACAQGVIKARELGVPEAGDLKALLGWKADAVAQAPDTLPVDPKLLSGFSMADDPADAPDEPVPPQLDKVVQQVFRFMSNKFQRLVQEAAASGKRLTFKQLKPHLHELNKQLDFLGLSIVAKQGK